MIAVRIMKQSIIVVLTGIGKLVIVANPTPSRNPVKTRIGLQLSLRESFCVDQSIRAGIPSMVG